jgi:hypothetical protein
MLSLAINLVMSSFVMLSDGMLSVIVLSVVIKFGRAEFCYAE